MKKIGYLLFFAVFLTMALAPFVGMLIAGPAPAAANETLAQPPLVKTDDGSFNTAVLKDASDYLADHFWPRLELITADATIEGSVFGESAMEKVILGKDGWLFYTSTLNDFQGEAQMTERQLWTAAHTLQLVQEYAASQGAQTLFVIVPNKNSVYPEYMPNQYLKTDAPKNLDRICVALDTADVSYLNLLPVLSASELQIYQRLDSHWNNLGAALAHDAILQALHRDEDALYDPAAFRAEWSHRGDLYEMLYPTGKELDLQWIPKWEMHFQYTRPIRSTEDQRIETSNPDGSGNLLMFRDSFGNTLHPYMAESFQSAVFYRSMPYDLTQIAQLQSDTVVMEIVERNLIWLAQRAPVMPAPVRELQLPADVTEIPASCVITPYSQMSCVSGTIEFSVDTDSPIWILANGVVYEASPVGESEGSFTAYLPDAPEQIQIVFMQSGSLIISQPLACEKD